MMLRFASLAFLFVALTGCTSSSELNLDGAVDAPADASDAADSGSVDSEVPLDAGREACVAPGASRAASCGNCGTRSERCVDGFWTPIGECLAQAECSPGATESRVEGECVPSQRVCTASCEWLPWETVGEPAPDAECSVGQLRWEISDACRPNHYIPIRCNETTCRWERGGCEDACAGEARQSPWEAEEICIPGGELMRGAPDWPGATPVGTVTLSPFYIDRYPISAKRYFDCGEACGATFPPSEEYQNRPVFGLSAQELERFCERDGRRLPTEAEWELAAKGPAPRNQAFTWSSPDRLCVAEAFGCGTPYRGEYPRHDIDALPNVRSVFGVDLMLFGVLEWTQDSFDPSFYERSIGTRDPVYRASGVARASRGFSSTAREPFGNVSARWEGIWEGRINNHGGRCARTP